MTNAELLNDVGTKISAVNDHGVAALKTADLTTAQSIYAMLYFAGKAGLSLQAVADAVLPKVDPVPTPVTGLRPGQVVVDVGSVDATVWRGSIDPNRSDITPTDWRAFLQNYERMPMVDIFSSSPAGKAKNADGSNFTPGDQSNPTIDIAAYKAGLLDGGIFAQWL